MARYRQVINEDGSSTFVPLDEAAIRRDAGHSIHGDIEPFRSPVDGSVISDRKQLREHNKKHGVVNAEEFSPEFYERKAKERARLYTGERTKEEVLKNRREIYEVINHLERQGR